MNIFKIQFYGILGLRMYHNYKIENSDITAGTIARSQNKIIKLITIKLEVGCIKSVPLIIFIASVISSRICEAEKCGLFVDLKYSSTTYLGFHNLMLQKFECLVKHKFFLSI